MAVHPAGWTVAHGGLNCSALLRRLPLHYAAASGASGDVLAQLLKVRAASGRFLPFRMDPGRFEAASVWRFRGRFRAADHCGSSALLELTELRANLGLGRIVALRRRSSASYRIR